MNDVLAGVFAPTLCRDDLSWSVSELRGAAMLEADVAISFLVADMFGQMMARLGIARAFVGHLVLSQSSFVERWYVALSARLRLAGLVSPWAGELLASAREDQPHSPEILFESGRVAELTAAGAGALQIKQRSPTIPALADRERERFYSRNLKEGIEWLRESAARRPAAPGPRLHLARLLIASGSGSDATILLDPLAAQDGDLDSAYVARLFLGGLAEQGGDLEAALRLYDYAALLKPGAQSAVVAAGVALMKMGRTAEARERLARLLVSDSKDEEIEDPWWGYFRYGRTCRGCHRRTAPGGPPVSRVILMLVAAGFLMPSRADQIFRSGADAVLVDVLVTDGRRPINGLSARDFELRDNGIVQTVTIASMTDVPLSLAMVMDVSASMSGRPLELLKGAARSALQALRKEDRVAVLSFSHSLALLTDWTQERTAVRAGIERLAAGGGTALNHAIAGGFIYRDSATTRGLILLFSDGMDTASAIPRAAVEDLSRRTDVVVYAVSLETHGSPQTRPDQTSGIELRPPRTGPSLLESVTDTTGGRVFRLTTPSQLEKAFLDIVSDFKSRYVLTYSPSGVSSTGWHELEVRLKARRARITARRGYQR